jgi:DNA polymerase-3 subunit chi
MARIDFYVLSQSGEQARQFFACRLAEKAYRLDHTVHIHARDRAEAHEVTRPGQDVPQSPVTVGCDAAGMEPRDLLINLCDDVPECIDTFSRIAELVSSDDNSKQQSRQRFATYRDQGHELDTHQV